MSQGRIGAVLVAGMVWSSLMAVPSLASEINDAPVGAIEMQIGTPVTADSSGADVGLSPDEPAPSCAAASHTLWYSFVTTEQSRLSISSFGSKVDTVLAVYDSALNEAACADDDLETGSLQARTTVSLPAGGYLVQLGTYDAPGASGGALRLTLEGSTVQPGDDIENAIDVTFPSSHTIDLADYSHGDDDDEHWCTYFGTTAYFKVVAPRDGVFSAQTGGEADALLGMISPAGDVQRCVDGWPHERLDVGMQAGEVAYVVVDLFWDYPSTVVDLAFDFSDPLPGDEPDTALELPIGVEVEGDLDGFSDSTADGGACAWDGPSVWYTATVEEAGTYAAAIRTDGHMHVSLFTSDPATSFADACDGYPAEVAAGEQVWIQVMDHSYASLPSTYVVELQPAILVDADVAGAIVRDDGYVYVGAGAFLAGAGVEVDPEHEHVFGCAYAVLVGVCAP